MPQVRLERPDRHPGEPREDRARAADLRAISDRRPRGVRLDEGDPLGAEARLLVRGPDGPLLPFLGRGEEPLAAPVVREAHSPDDAVDRVAVPPRVLETLQDDEGGSLRGDETVGSLVKGARAAAPAQGAESGESDVQEQVVGALHGAREHHVGLAVVEAVAGELDGVERARAGGVEAEDACSEPQRAAQESGGPAAHEPVPRVDGGSAAPVAVPDPDASREGGHPLRGEAEVAEDGPGPWPGDRRRSALACGPGLLVPRVSQRLPGRVENPVHQIGRALRAPSRRPRTPTDPRSLRNPRRSRPGRTRRRPAPVRRSARIWSGSSPQRPSGAGPTRSRPAATRSQSADGSRAPGRTQDRPTMAIGAKATKSGLAAGRQGVVLDSEEGRQAQRPSRR